MSLCKQPSATLDANSASTTLSMIGSGSTTPAGIFVYPAPLADISVLKIRDEIDSYRVVTQVVTDGWAVCLLGE